ncbi:MAG: ABC transporter ATP-binding protein [Planctomycetota bacterium]|nr:ABC transporter ATP-binding protein [Planctomycetota bacterium]
MGLLSLQNVSKTYEKGLEKVHALSGLTLEIEKGDNISVMGPSGSGKSTLLYVVGLMDRPTAGRYMVAGTDISTMDDDQMSRARNKWFGFVFQSFNLFPQLSVVENIEVPMVYAGIPRPARRRRADELASLVGLSARLKHKPSELSGGEMQRTAIARALSNRPEVLLADEPTGNLDTTTAAQIVDVLKQLNDGGVTLIIITHNAEIGEAARRRIRLRDGKMIE